METGPFCWLVIVSNYSVSATYWYACIQKGESVQNFEKLVSPQKQCGDAYSTLVLVPAVVICFYTLDIVRVWCLVQSWKTQQNYGASFCADWHTHTITTLHYCMYNLFWYYWKTVPSLASFSFPYIISYLMVVYWKRKAVSSVQLDSSWEVGVQKVSSKPFLV